MLEVLNNLAQSDEEFKHNVVFLFNGAEENLVPVNFLGEISITFDFNDDVGRCATSGGLLEIIFQLLLNFFIILKSANYQNRTPIKIRT